MKLLLKHVQRNKTPSLESLDEERRTHKLLEDASRHYCSLPGTNLWTQRNQWALPGVALPNMAERTGERIFDESASFDPDPAREAGRGIFGFTLDPETGQPAYDGTLAQMTMREQTEVQEALEALDPPPVIDPFIVARLIDHHREEYQSLRAKGWQELDAILILIRSLWAAKRILDRAEYHRRWYTEHRDELRERKKEHYRTHRGEILQQHKEYYYSNHDEIRERANENRRQLRLLRASWDLKNRQEP